jgi:hypothetical protein
MVTRIGKLSDTDAPFRYRFGVRARHRAEGECCIVGGTCEYDFAYYGPGVAGGPYREPTYWVLCEDGSIVPARELDLSPMTCQPS